MIAYKGFALNNVFAVFNFFYEELTIIDINCDSGYFQAVKLVINVTNVLPIEIQIGNSILKMGEAVFPSVFFLDDDKSPSKRCMGAS